MAFVDEKDSDRRRKSSEQHAGAKDQPRVKDRPSADVGRALRSAYDRTVGEDIPPEMLDLLGKLS